MNVLILGGTSFFGKDIARFFHEKGAEITLFTRGTQMPADLPPHHHFKGDRSQLDDLKRVAKSGAWDVVIDNIAFEREHVEKAVEAFSHVKRYLLMSTVSVYRFSKEQLRFPQPLTENAVDYLASPPNEDPTDVHWKYARGKLEAERVLISRKDIPWTILRPPVVYGPFDTSDRGFWYVGRILKGGPIIAGNGAINSFRLAFGPDVARATVEAALHPKAEREIYNVTQDEVITLRDFITASAQALDMALPQLVNVPLELVKELAGPYATMTNLIFDGGKARRELNVRPTPFQEFVATTARWFRDHWKGDEERLFTTRKKELDFVERWKHATNGLGPRD